MKTLTSNGYINKDLDGNTRGADGTWDIGTYEYGTNAVSAPRRPRPSAGATAGTFVNDTSSDPYGIIFISLKPQ